MNQTRASCWSVTINNPIKADEENINIARQKGWTVEGQMEKGENGTEHYQLVVKTPQVRFSALKKAFPRAHIEVARNSTALELYCKKEETRIQELKPSTAYVSQAQVWAWFGIEYDDNLEKSFSQTNAELMRQSDGERNLTIFDKMINKKIREGFYVELIGTNPQIRSCIKNYGPSIANRERTLRQKTDRQTDDNLVPSIEQNEDTVEEEESYEETRTEGETCSSVLTDGEGSEEDSTWRSRK